MKVVLSRKGMDSRAGGIPSPILPDGTLLSLPIPNEKSGVPYGDLVYKGRTYQQIIQQIHPTFDFQKHPFCHLDPDIYGVLKNTHAGWKPAFGQYEIPAKHLDGQGVDVGDVFLFYGMFRQTEKLPDGTLHFVKGAPIQHIIYCLQYTESHAMELPLEEVKYRIASRDKSVIYDLQNGKCVVVNEKGWRIVDNIYPMFLKGADEIEQVMPIHGSGKKGFDRIDRYLNLSPEEKFLLKVYLVTCFNPDITFPSVSINGTNGSGKSTLSRIIKKIIDPSSNELETLPDTIDDLRVRLNQDYYLAFDNLSSISKKQSDFLCAAITGVTSSNRMKYTDNTINSVYIKRGMCLNGISPFVQKADLAERVLFFTAKLIKDTSRISDMTFWKDFSADLPYILGGIFDLYSKAMKILPTVKLQKLQRLADFHLFGYAVAEAMKTGLGKKFNEVLEDNKTRQMEITCQNAMIISLVEDFLKNEEDEGYWKGTMSLLYKSLKDFMSQQNMTEEIYNPRTYPKEANHLSRALHQYEAAFASKGIHFQSKKNSKGNMEIEITTDWLKDDIGTIKRVPIITSKT